MNYKNFSNGDDSGIQVDLTVQFKSSKESKDLKYGRVKDFSASGLFIETLTPFSIESPIIVLLYLPYIKKTIILAGKVVCLSSKEKENIQGMGIQITSSLLSEEDKQNLKEYFDMMNFYGWF